MKPSGFELRNRDFNIKTDIFRECLYENFCEYRDLEIAHITKDCELQLHCHRQEHFK